METRNVTLAVPEPLLKRFRIFAAERDSSMSALMTSAIQDLLDRETGRREAADRLVQRMRSSPNRSKGKGITWTRDQLHER